MSLGHVYIVLEPVGSACLTFDDDRYYEFMCFDIPKVVQSPGYDHGHDEEFRNGPEVKNYIYRKFCFGHRESFGVTRYCTGTTGRVPGVHRVGPPIPKGPVG